MSDIKENKILSKNHEETFTETLMRLLENLFENFFSSNTVEYKHNAAAQKNTGDAIMKMEELSKSYLDNGQYAEAYLVSRQTEIMRAAHETAIGLDKKEHGREHWKNSERDTFIAVAKDHSLSKLEDLDKNNTSRIAFNEYKGTSDPVELSAVFDNVKEATGEIYGSFDKRTNRIFRELTAMDLNELKEINDMPTSTPEELAKTTPTSNLGNEKESSLDRNNERSADGPADNGMSSGPGR